MLRDRKTISQDFKQFKYKLFLAAHVLHSSVLRLPNIRHQTLPKIW